MTLQKNFLLRCKRFHWNNAMVRIHPFVVYYRNVDTHATDPTFYVAISDCFHHDSLSAHLLQGHLIHFLTTDFQEYQITLHF